MVVVGEGSSVDLCDCLAGLFLGGRGWVRVRDEPCC